MRKKSRNPASKESSGLREKAKGGLPDGALAFFFFDFFFELMPCALEALTVITLLVLSGYSHVLENR